MTSPGASRLWDISQALRPGLPVWPGDTAFSARARWTLGDDSPVNVSSFETSTHAGTHADAPLHYDASGAGAGEADLSVYVGACRVIDARDQGFVLTRAFVSSLASPPARLLFRTYAAFPHDAWSADFTSIAADAVDLLAERGVKLIGVDAPSLDPQTSKSMAAHHAVRRADMRILEGLVLDHVAPGDYELIALPLKLEGLDASPVRAILREIAS